MFLYMEILYTQIWSEIILFFSKGVGGVSSLSDGIKGVSAVKFLCLWGSPLLANDLDSWCDALCVRHIELNIVGLAVVVWYLKVQFGT